MVAGRLVGFPTERAQRRHLLALEQAGDKPEPFVHDVTLLPRHAPPEGRKCHPCVRRNTVLPISQAGQLAPIRGPNVRRISTSREF